MKLNKSILGLVVLFIFILSSCSQTRYGHLTHRTKATHIAKTKESPRVKKKAGLIPATKERIAKNNKVEELITDEVTGFAKVEVIYDLKKEVQTRKSTVIPQRKFKKVTSNANTLKKLMQDKREVLSEVSVNRMTTSSAKPAEEEMDLLKLILLIILVLLIVGLILTLLPVLRWLAWIVLLAFLIWLLLQYV